jgi:hypothetical protein
MLARVAEFGRSHFLPRNGRFQSLAAAFPSDLRRETDLAQADEETTLAVKRENGRRRAFFGLGKVAVSRFDAIGDYTRRFLPFLISPSTPACLRNRRAIENG